MWDRISWRWRITNWGRPLWRGAGGPLKVSVHPSGNPRCVKPYSTLRVQAGTPRAADINDVNTVAQRRHGLPTRDDLPR